jgi:hypothetical protein
MSEHESVDADVDADERASLGASSAASVRSAFPDKTGGAVRRRGRVRKPRAERSAPPTATADEDGACVCALAGARVPVTPRVCICTRALVCGFHAQDAGGSVG